MKRGHYGLMPRRHSLMTTCQHFFFLLLICLTTLGTLMSGWATLVQPVYAAGHPTIPAASLTLQKFLQQGSPVKGSGGHFIPPQHPPKPPESSKTVSASTVSKLLPSAEPPTMKPIQQNLDSSFFVAPVVSQTTPTSPPKATVTPTAIATSTVTGTPEATATVTPTSTPDVTATPSLTPTATPTVPAQQKPLVVMGSDQRLEFRTQPGSFDLSRATVPGGSAPVAPFRLSIKQIHGHYIGDSVILGSYQIQILDAQGRVVSGLHLLQPVTIIYHYQPDEITSLGLDPAQLHLTWAGLLDASNKKQALAHVPNSTQAPPGLIIPLLNNARARTLTAQSSVLDVVPLAIGGDTTIQQPPVPNQAAVGGNGGGVTYSYPIKVPPGPGGMSPTIALSYSSQAVNEHHSSLTPASDVGEGWSLSMGSISVEEYPSKSTGGAKTWYSISGVSNVSDRLIQDPAQSGGVYYQTQRISRLRIHGINTLPGDTGAPYFRVFDKNGYFYEFGYTADSRQYTTDSTGKVHYYRLDLDKIYAPPNAGNQVRVIFIDYLQDSTSSNGHTSIRDAAIKQISYGFETTTVGRTLDSTQGTIDFHYHVPTVTSAYSSWETAYGSWNYECGNTAPPYGTTLRCDDPVLYNNVAPPTAMGTLTLDSITTFVGCSSISSSCSSGTSSYKAMNYSLSYQNTPYNTSYIDPYTKAGASGAGTHLLTQVTPTVYQSGTGHPLKGVQFTYSSKENFYYDGSQKNQAGDAYIGYQTWWNYLTKYIDLETGVGETITYGRAESNMHGTDYILDGQGNVIDDRRDPLFCPTHPSPSPYNCTGVNGHSQDHVWSAQVVTQTQALGKDSGNSAVGLATTTYAYRLNSGPNVQGTLGHYSMYVGPTYCNKAANASGTVPPGQSDCALDTWMPGYNSVSGGDPDGDWQDYYHGEFHGFNGVYITDPGGNLTTNFYLSTAGWYTPSGLMDNYAVGGLYEQDVYTGNQALDNKLLRKTTNKYAGGDSSNNSCNGNLDIEFNPCEEVVYTSKTTDYEGTGSGNTNAPYVQTDYTYDDYSYTGGLVYESGYHNLLQSVVTSTNGSKSIVVTNKWQYKANDDASKDRYTVDKVSHSEVDDSSGHVWNCQDFKYDEGIAGGATTPVEGWQTTATAHTDCSSPTAQNATAINTYTGYDIYGNPVTNVNATGAANPSLYSGSSGCVPSTAPTYQSAAPTTGRYTRCTTFGSYYHSYPTSITNALGQVAATTYDFQQGGIPIQTTDVNNQPTNITYSYNAGNATVSTQAPISTGSYSATSSTNSSCSSTSSTPCYEIDTHNYLYSGAISSTYYDNLGRKIETRAPSPKAGYDLVSFTVYNDAANSVFTSQPFEVVHGTGWQDPNGLKDYNGVTPGGNSAFSDAKGRPIATQDPMLGSPQEPGISCPGLTGMYTTCTFYGLGTANGGDSTTYAYVGSLDANNHLAVSFNDARDKTIYTQWYTGKGFSSLSARNSAVNEQKTFQYNGIGLPTSVTVIDLVPQTGQSTVSVSASTTYDDMGRITSTSDPDRGSHTLTYDPNGKILTDVSGTRTLGYNYDLLGRTGCVQDAVPTINATGACTSGTHPYIQNTYDTSILGGTDFPIGQLTQSLATTYLPDGSTATATNQARYDQRGRTTESKLFIGVPGAWNVTAGIPGYQQDQTYNDANQNVTHTFTTTGGDSSTTTQVYDSSTGISTGLSNNGTATADLATISYNSHGLLDTLSFLSSTGSQLATEQFGYDANFRPVSANAVWQVGSGTSGTIANQSRTYDPNGNVTSLLITQATVPGAISSGGTETQNFCYDEQDRMVWSGNGGSQPGAGNGVCGTGTLNNTLGGAGYTNSFVYTHLGQIWQAPLNGDSSHQYQYLYCDSAHPHQLTGVYQPGTTCATKSTSNQVYTSSDDAWGSVTSRWAYGTASTLSYDGLDHMTQWTSGSNTESYVYDASGQRVLRRSTNNGTTQLYTYPFGMSDFTYNSAGGKTGNTYYYSLGGTLIGTLSGGSTSFMMIDGLGSPLANISSTAGSAKVLGNQGYGPYGTRRYQQGTLGTSKGFTGQYADDLSGLDYYVARYYDPVVGRFLSADVAQGNLAGMDPYGYVNGNPETKNDPTGRYIVDGNGNGYRQVNNVIPYRRGALVPFKQDDQDWSPLPVVTCTPGIDSGCAGPVFHHTKANTQSHSSQPTLTCRMARATCVPDTQTSLERTVIGLSFAFDGFSILLALAEKSENPVAMDNLQTSKERWDEINQELEKYVQDCIAEGLSFTYKTLVSTDHGKKPIGSLHIGEKVWAYNPKTRKMELESILHVWINHDNDLVDLTIASKQSNQQGKHQIANSEVVHTTKKHPFLTIERGFLPVANVKVGMHIQQADGHVGVITNWQMIPGSKTMYNLEVAKDHTYVVGLEQWVVHNCTYNAGDTTAGGLTYSEHGAESATTRGFTSDIIDNIVRNFKPRIEWHVDDNDAGILIKRLRYQDSRGNVVITDQYTQDIITVYGWHPDTGEGGFIPKP